MEIAEYDLTNVVLTSRLDLEIQRIVARLTTKQ